MDASLFPVGSHVSSHGIPGLDPNSYTAHRLKHASAEHLHQTSQRFFIGPIPEGWLSSNRKSWYKRKLELSSYSSRAATFTAAAGQRHHSKTMTAMDKSMQARMSFSFPQPEDIEDSGSGSEQETETAEDAETDADTGTEDEFFDTTELEPVSTEAQEPHAETRNEAASGSQLNSLQQVPDQPYDDSSRRPQTPPHIIERPASSELPDPATKSPRQTAQSRSVRDSDGEEIRGTSTERQYLSASNTASSSLRQNGYDGPQDIVDNTSQTALLPKQDQSSGSPASKNVSKMLSEHEPAPLDSQSPETQPQIRRGLSQGVRFKITEAVADQQRRVEDRAGRARKKITRRKTLREGTIVKMEKMLVRVDVTLQQVPDFFDENGSMQIETRPIEKWREFMVVARKSKKSADDDFRLQFWKTRVIPEIHDESSSRNPTREIKLIRKTTNVNLYSSLDKTVVIWHPYKKGTRIFIMKPESTANSVEWYTFLRDALGWKRPDKLQVSVPNLGVSLQIEKPFEALQRAAMESTDEDAAIRKAEEAEQAVAGKIVTQCIEMLEGNPEWTSVIHAWHETSIPGLAWKRYDRLEWIHGVNEQKMYGSMAMQHSYDLELRPKVHYPQVTYGKKGKEHEEPAPIEGFLIRMTSQKGIHKRMGKTYYKRLYFHTQNYFLLFNRPAAAIPPHPPRLQTITGANIPSASEIIEKTPMMFDVDPYPLDTHPSDGHGKSIRWLTYQNRDRIERADREALEEARRNFTNLDESDGYINLTHIRKVRRMQWGTDEVDENLESGSDVDFHESVRDTETHDGTTTSIDDGRIFELLLENGLVIRLQAYDKRTRDEWIDRLRKLVKYWKLRKSADLTCFKSVRASNLQQLQIDEDVEAELGQFGHKWEMTRSEASPQLYNVCPISACRTVTLSGLLYRKPRRRGTFYRCGVILAGGKMQIYQSSLRTVSGLQVPHIHHDKQEVIDLKGCYIYSGLITQDDLLYQNKTFNANHMGSLAPLPRVWPEDGWTSSDVDLMTCFVVWQNRKKGWFRTGGALFGSGSQTSQSNDEGNGGEGSQGKARAKLKRVRQLGVPGRAMVFKCRSRAERDLWVLNLGIEIDRLVAREKWEEEEAGGEIRWAE